MKSTVEKGPPMKSDRRLSLPVVDRLDYNDRLKLHPSTSTVGVVQSDGELLDLNKNDTDDMEPMDTPIVRRRRTHSTPDADCCIPAIVIDEAPSTGSDPNAHAAAMANLRQMSRITFKMDHLRIGNVLAEHVNEQQQKSTAVLLKRQELANEQITKPTSPPGNRRKSVPNLKSVLEEDGGDE